MEDRVDQAIRQMAEREGVSEEMILQELQTAIDAGYASADPKVQQYWQTLPFQGKPTPRELIAYLAGVIASGRE